MNRRLGDLAAFCNQYPLDEKVLVCASYSIGRQITESLARQGHPHVNLRAETVSGLASALVAEELAAEELTALSSATQLALVEQAIDDATGLLSEPGSYFGPLREVPGLAPALAQGIQDLRTAGLDPECLEGTDALVSPRKAEELKRIYENYVGLLKEHRLYDRAELLSRALKALREGTPHPFQDAHFLIMEELPLAAVRRDLLAELAGDKLHLVGHDPVSGLAPDPGAAAAVLGTEAQGIEPTDHEPSALGDLFSLAKSARKGSEPTIKLKRGLGEGNEVREVFRGILERGVSIDEVEVVCTDAEAYIPLFIEASARLGIPCTYADGIPILMTGPGQAALGFLDWIQEDFGDAVLRRMLSARALDLRPFAKERGLRDAPAPIQAIRHLRNAQIGWGRDRYLTRLEELKKTYEAKLESADTDDFTDDHTPGSGSNSDRQREEGPQRRTRRQNLEKAIGEINCLAAFTARALELVAPGPGSSLAELAQAVRAFVGEFAATSSVEGAAAAPALMSRLEELGAFPIAGKNPGWAPRRLRDVIAGIRLGARGPEPGHLHVSSPSAGGYSGRRELIVLGLDEQRFPGTSIQEPILLDRERTELNRSTDAGLALGEDRPSRNLVRLTACLASHRGNLTLSYSGYNLLEAREVFPSSVMLQAHRLSTGRREDDYSALSAALAAPIGFIPGARPSLTETEWWLTQLKPRPRPAGTQAVLDREFAWLAAGRSAQEQRNGKDFTVYDGYLPNAGAKLDFRVNGRAVSPSRLEELARCPFAYFLRHVLHVEPLEELARDPEVWLDPLQFGSLLHAVFEEFMIQLRAQSRKPNPDKLHKGLREAASRKVKEYEQLCPPPGDAARSRTLRDIERALDIFLSHEFPLWDDWEPCFFEVPFGIKDADLRKAGLGSPEPVSIGAGQDQLKVRGMIDRIDRKRSDSSQYQIWDYKTGSTWKHRRDRTFYKGQVLQFALYARAAAQLLKEEDANAEVSQSGYFFTGPKGEGERIEHPAQEFRGLDDILCPMLEMLHNGAFCHTNDESACSFCDYQAVCGDTGAVTSQAGTKLANAADASSPLHPYKLLRGV